MILLNSTKIKKPLRKMKLKLAQIIIILIKILPNKEIFFQRKWLFLYWNI